MNSAEHTGRLFRMACTVILSFVAAVFLLVSLAGYPAVAGAAEIAAVPGDADGNGVAEAQDTVLLQEYLLGEVTENALSPGADWDGNGRWTRGIWCCSSGRCKRRQQRQPPRQRQPPQPRPRRRKAPPPRRRRGQQREKPAPRLMM